MGILACLRETQERGMAQRMKFKKAGLFALVFISLAGLTGVTWADDEADQEAVEWLLSGVSDPAVIRKRAFGIAIGTLALIALRLEEGSFESTTHPEAFKRLYACLSQSNLDENHEVYAFAITIIKMHMDRSGIDIPEAEHVSFSSYLDELMFLLARWRNL